MMPIFQRLQKFFREDIFTHSSLLRNSLLAYFVLSSKHLIIYNEETLVLISFIGFVLFSTHMMGESVKNSLNERSLGISQELENSLQVKNQFFHELFHEHQKQFSLKNLFQKFHHSASREIFTMNSQREKSLQSFLSQEILQKLQSILTSHQNFQEKLQKSFSLGFRPSIFQGFLTKKKTMKSTLLLQALRHLKRHRMPHIITR
jgi:F0F1-type ATP synthase membrane subunit b/b'